MFVQVSNDRMARIRQVEHQLVAIRESPVVCKYQVQDAGTMLVRNPWDFSNVNAVMGKAADLASVVDFQIPAM